MDAAGQHFASQAPTGNVAKTITSVSRSFNFAMLSVVSVLLFCFAAVAIIVTIKLSEQELEQKLTNSINVAKTSLSQALWNLDEKIVSDFIDSVLLDESFVYAAVLWEKQIVAEKKRASIKALSVEEIERSEDFITKSDVIQFDGKDIGIFFVAVSRDSIFLKIILNALGTFALAICVVAGVSATSLFITRKYISQPLLQLHGSATKIAQGDLEAPIELNRQDEFGLLAQNFDAMRGSIKTLVGELRENNRTLEERVDQRTSEAAEAMQVAEEARGRLVDALESTHEGFLLCDAEDRLVLANPRYLEMYPGIADLVVPGTPYQTILRALVDRNLIGSDNQDPESWFERRLNFHRDPKGAHLYRLQDGRWVQVTERRTDAGGTVSVFADITDLKESEQRAATANHLITQSLRYASRIQAAILPGREELASVTADHFLIWEPRDIVGGDFFWFQKIPDGYALIVGDCTGHGVPGAFMTLVTWGLLDRTLQTAPTDKPSQVLSGLHEGVQALLGQHRQDGETDDGLEAGICFVNEKTRQLFFSGARFSLWHANGKGVQEIKGDRASLGYRRYSTKTEFNDVSLKIADGSAFYMTTDGLIDQIGGPRGRSFGKRRFKSFVQQNVGQAMVQQSANLTNALVKYQGKEVRRDDLTVLGFVP
jgi:serine phosphatase RsbU (regulator of sigma subunit)/HAMP domain-containing protein